MNIEEHPIHVLTTALKCFFRELPEPLLTFELYDEFLQASGTVKNPKKFDTRKIIKIILKYEQCGFTIQ